jgi:hypothetical protein
MRPRSVVVVALILLGATSASAQGLADAGRPIGSKSDESKGLVIDNSNLTKASTSSRVVTGSSWVLETVEESVESLKELNLVLTETASDTVFFDSEWRRRVADSIVRFRLAQSDLSINEPDPRYLRSLDRLQEGIDAAETAIVALEAAIENDQALYVYLKKDLIAAEKAMESAFAQLRADYRVEQAEAPAPPIDPIAADRSISTLCGRRYGSGTDNYTACVSSQQAAINQIMVRSAPGSGLGAPSFNTIRNQCRWEYPDDYVGRDRCEVRRIAARLDR